MAFRLRDKQKVALCWAICFSLFVFLYLVLSTPTFATGWEYISKTHKPSADMWSSYESPHGNFSVASNKCRVCHALHKANPDSYRLLFDNSRLTACDRCHDPVTGLSGKKPYRLFSSYQIRKKHKNYNRADSGKNPEKVRIIGGKPIVIRETQGSQSLLPEPTPVTDAKGEHTPGVGFIPESNIPLPPSFSPDGLNCYSCHDPHFVPENTIQSIPRWRDRGLLRDPGENGGDAEDGLISVQPYSQQNKPIAEASANPSVDEIKTAFCSDCHNQNPSWSDASDYRPNVLSHPIHVDMFVDVYGQMKQVAETKADSCMSCHSATTETDDSGNYLGPSSFPHQSVGNKLLSDDYKHRSAVLESGQYGGYTGDPYRPLAYMDVFCRSCHSKVGKNSSEGF